jgi:aminoglycoside phosphotransferase (APT) family kinase protein
VAPVEDMPAAEVDVSVALVRALLAEQHGDLAELPLRELASGWDNVTYRLGDALTVRVPRRAMAAALVEHEQRWLPQLAPRLPLPVPAPMRVGRPGCGYPWSWSICPWLDGVAAADREPDDPFATAAQLGAFLRALHTPASPDAPANPYRGVPLSDRSPSMHERVERLGTLLDRHAVLDAWSRVLEVPRWSGPPVWLHGDLHPANVLVHAGRVAAVIDFGDITAGDPATDLSIAWMILPAAARPAFRAAAGVIDDDTWTRARGWALALAVAYLANSADNPQIARVGRYTLAAVLADG